jgi:hypothetical protein
MRFEVRNNLLDELVDLGLVGAWNEIGIVCGRKETQRLIFYKLEKRIRMGGIDKVERTGDACEFGDPDGLAVLLIVVLGSRS